MKLFPRLECVALMATIMIMFIAISYAQSEPPHTSPTDSSMSPPNSALGAASFGKGGLLLANEDISTQLRVHGFIQADGRFFTSDLKDQRPDKLFFRRIRPTFEGTLFKALDFRLMPDFGQNNPQIQDAYMELKLFSFAKPRVGKFKTPIGLEDLRSDSESSFSERSLASDVVPLREVGAQVGGAVLHQLLS